MTLHRIPLNFLIYEENFILFFISALATCGPKKASSHSMVITRDTHNRDREKSSGETQLDNIWTIRAMDRTSALPPQVKLSLLRSISAQPQVNLSLLRSKSLKFQPLSSGCPYTLMLLYVSQYRSLTAIGQKKASPRSMIFTRDTRNRDRKKSSDLPVQCIWTIRAMDSGGGRGEGEGA